jgi:hypothetical protein
MACIACICHSQNPRTIPSTSQVSGPVVRNTSLTFDTLIGQYGIWQYTGVTFLNSEIYTPAAGKATVSEGGE